MEGSSLARMEVEMKRVQEKLRNLELMILDLQDQTGRQRNPIQRTNNGANFSFLEAIDMEKLGKIALFITTLYNQEESEDGQEEE
ncbi:hypothetical protein [Bacillus sp. SG-1]|uniref:hypothetical protein n=1 Tax=Bacillus sp. SG-1 TaxID=161544 RepID=UPI0001544CF6|nr:hypothetical protein [Bacillus sp. SG-1]EDL64258.1 hypothetical protein BSG1_00225 [Bacillus sp. SG-1]